MMDEMRAWMKYGVMLVVLAVRALAMGAEPELFGANAMASVNATMSANAAAAHLEDAASLMPTPMPRIKASAKSTADTYTGTGDLDVTMSHGQTITLYFDVDKAYTRINSAKLVLYMWDVDYPCATEQDNVYFNGSYLGRLEGLNQGWDYNDFDVPTSKITVPAATGGVSRNTVTIDVSVDPSGWVTRCGSAQLIIDGDTFALTASRDIANGISVNWDKAYGSYDLYRKGPGESDFTRIRQGITTNGCFDTDVQIGKPYAYYATQGGAKATAPDGASSTDVGLAGQGDLPRVTLTGMSPIIIGVTTEVKLTLDIQAPNRYKDVWDLAEALKESHVEADAYHEGTDRVLSPRFDFDDASPMSDGKTVRAIYTVSTKNETFNILALRSF